MTGFMGQKFDFTGEDGEWYALIADDNMNINMRVTSPVPELPVITYITGEDRTMCTLPLLQIMYNSHVLLSSLLAAWYGSRFLSSQREGFC